MKFFLKIICLFFIACNNASSRRARHDRDMRQAIQDGLDDYLYTDDELTSDDSDSLRDYQPHISTVEIPLTHYRVPHDFFEKWNEIRSCYFYKKFNFGHKKRTE